MPRGWISQSTGLYDIQIKQLFKEKRSYLVPTFKCFSNFNTALCNIELITSKYPMSTVILEVCDISMDTGLMSYKGLMS